MFFTFVCSCFSTSLHKHLLSLYKQLFHSSICKKFIIPRSKSKNKDVDYIDRRIFTRSSIGGWVLKRPESQPCRLLPLNGFTIKRCAVAFVAVESGLGSAEIFSR